MNYHATMESTAVVLRKHAICVQKIYFQWSFPTSGQECECLPFAQRMKSCG